MSSRDKCRVSGSRFINSTLLLLERLMDNSSFKLPRSPKVEKSSIVIDGLPGAFDGFTIWQIADVHYGRAA